MIKLSAVISLLIALNCFGQIDSATTEKLNTYQFGGIFKSAVSVNLGGVTGFGGITYDYFLGSHWRLEAGVGYWSAGFGFDYYPWAVKREESRFKINFRNSIFYPISANIIFHSFGVGMTHFFKEKLNLGFDVGVSYIHDYDDWKPFDWVLDDVKSGWILYPHFNVKLGYRFSVKFLKRKKELERGN
ncbi:MAG: hypothetical protein R2780_05040 [Crocinitomicaceae bacterium]|nr:hypothetical protein [Crocinitomicaceae bacterium]